MTFNKEYLGTSLEDWLEGEGILQESTIAAAKKVIAWQLSEEMRKKKITKMRMAELMETSRAQLDRVLDPMSSNTTLETLQRAAKIVGRELRVELV
jgi:antitoxin HicB